MHVYPTQLRDLKLSMSKIIQTDIAPVLPTPVKLLVNVMPTVLLVILALMVPVGLLMMDLLKPVY